jgi:hypothetical protein
MLGETLLFQFMSKYYNRSKLENKQDVDSMFQIYNLLHPDNKQLQSGCDTCVVEVFNKLKKEYEILNSKL